MSWIKYQITQKDQSVAYPPAFGRVLNPPASSPSSSSARISPTVLFVIVILAVLFFISGLLHLLVKFLVKQRQPSSSASPRSNRYNEIPTSDVLQRQLQQLFHLHDSGLDQAFIDALPVFQYKEIVGGTKEPFDCAVCLCEFLEKDKLRLLPMCSHAFHVNCIDTWLLSNSTCPLCRGTLYAPGFPMENAVLDFDDTIVEDLHQKNVEMEETTVQKGVLPVRLGKFRKLADENPSQASEETSSSNLDARRCFSMGSYQYVLGKSDLRVPFSQDHQRNRDLQSERVGESSADGDSEAKKITSMTKGESFSVSKIWLWSRKTKFSSDYQGDIPYSLNTDLPWMEEHKRRRR